MGLSFQEKSIWGTLVITVTAYGYYCLRLFGVTTGEPSREIGSLLIGVLTAIVVAEILYHIAIAIPSAKDEIELQGDERGKLIQHRAQSWGGEVLGVFTIMAIGRILIQDAFYPPVDIMLVANILIGGFVCAEVTKCTMQLILYRRGV